MLRLFVAGSPRSGTTFTSAVLGAHPDLDRIRHEVRFHAVLGGLADTVSGRFPLAAFLDRMNGQLYRARRGKRQVGLHRIVGRRRLAAALKRFERDFEAARPDAAGRLIAALLDGTTRRRGWIDHTPETARCAATISAALPDAGLVLCVRDGRDVASSVAARPWGPETIMEAMRWWCRYQRVAAPQVAAWPDKRRVVVRFESFLDTGFSDEQLEQLGVAPHPDLDRYLHRHRGDAHIGRWQHEAEAAAVDAAYRASRIMLREVEGGDIVDDALGEFLAPPRDMDRHREEQAAYDHRAAAEERSLLERLVEGR